MNKSTLSDLVRRFRGAIFAFCMLILFALVIYFTRDIRLLVVNTTVDARFWPKIIGWAGCILSALLFLQSVVEGVAQGKKERAGLAEKPSRSEGLLKGNNLRTLTTLALMFLYIWGLEPLGFVVMTLIYLFCQFLVLLDKKTRSFKRLALVTAVFTAVVYLLFRYVFQMMLPTGTWWAHWGGSL